LVKLKEEFKVRKLLMRKEGRSSLSQKLMIISFPPHLRNKKIKIVLAKTQRTSLLNGRRIK